MHSFIGRSGITYHYNSDFSGDIIICRDNANFHVPSEELIALVLDRYVINHLISILERVNLRRLLEEWK